MSLFRLAAMWSLRALLLWGAIEIGGGLYERGLGHAASLAEIAGHRAAMTRLEERAGVAEVEAQAAEAALAGLSGQAWALSPNVDETLARAAVRTLREELIELGAQAPVVEASEAGGGEGLVRVTLTARWREPVEASPSVLHALAERRPDVRIERLRLERDQLVITELQLSTPLRALPRREASR